MQYLSWLSFFHHGIERRTAIHFVPIAEQLAAPYPAQCRITIFSPLFERRSVTIEGIRLGDPNGLFLDDAFPQLTSLGSCRGGVLVELSITQTHFRITPSHCFIEYWEGVDVLRLRPPRRPMLTSRGNSQASDTSFVVAVEKTSRDEALLLINEKSSERHLTNENVRGLPPNEDIQPVMIPPEGIREIPLQKTLTGVSLHQIPEGMAGFLVTRASGEERVREIRPVFAT
jgi:hypothetical protein